MTLRYESNGGDTAAAALTDEKKLRLAAYELKAFSDAVQNKLAFTVSGRSEPVVSIKAVCDFAYLLHSLITDDHGIHWPKAVNRMADTTGIRAEPQNAGTNNNQ